MASPALAASYAHCRGIARTAARNFYYGISLLPAAKRDALCAVYAFMREADDIADGPGETAEKQQKLAAWRAALDRTLAGDDPGHPAMPAFHDAVARYHIPAKHLHDLIAGTEMDLTVHSYATFDRLREYCYRVAGCVGLSCIHVFGFQDPRAPEFAEKLGIAFQLTNILRDLREDLAAGRVYLPQEDLDRFGVGVADFGRPLDAKMLGLMRFQVDRAWQFYDEGIQLLDLIDADSRAALWALARIYSGILGEMEARDYDVFSSRVGLSTSRKMWIMLRARLGWWPKEDVLEDGGGHRRRLGGTILRRRAD